MSRKEYDLNEITTKMENKITRAKGLLSAWQAVTFPTKKDGTAFKILSKNIDGATLAQSKYNPHYGENILTVYTDYLKGCGYCSDDIYCYDTVSAYTNNKRAEEKPENVIINEYGTKVYSFDLDDIKQAVKDRISYLTQRIAELEAQYSNIEKIYSDFYNAYETAINNLSDATRGKDGSNRDLFYLVRDTVKDNILIGRQ